MRRSRLGLLLVLGMLAALLPIGAVAPAAATTGDLVITGVVDGPLSGGIPKAVELYVVNEIADLSIYGLGSANNGGGTDGEEFNFPVVAASAGDYIYVASESAGFTDFFGFAPDYTSGSAISINGDDAIELFQSGSVVDIFGFIDVDGSGQPWEYTDGWAYRVDGTGQDGSTFVLANWTFSGPNALNGEITNATAATPFPIGTPPPPPPVEIIINEIMQNPSAVFDSAGEWFELYNPTAAPIDIDGWTIADNDSDSFAVANGGPLVVPAGGYLVLGNNGDSGTNGGVAVDYVYADMFLSNSSDELVLIDGLAAEVDRVEWDGGPTFPDPNGASMSLSDSTLDNNDGANWCEAGSPFGAGDFGSPGAANDCAPPPPTAIPMMIHEIQGSGFASPVVGAEVVIEGIVVGDFQGNDFAGWQLGGFFVQEESVDWDVDESTSEGVFVYAPGGMDVAVGDVVSVTGTVEEFHGKTQIGFVSEVVVLGTADAVGTEVGLPVVDASDWEKYEGMLLTFPQTLTISEFFNFDRFGEIVLTTARQYQGTHLTYPGSGAVAIAEANDLARVIVDDGRGSQNPDPAIHPNGLEFDLANYFRGGDTVQDMTGVMDYNFGAYKLQPVHDATIDVTYTSVNTRPTAPDAIPGDIRVATFNVLNFFTHLDDGPDAYCGPTGVPRQCRGADNAGEYQRQLDKLLAGIIALDADIVGIQEIENDIRDDDDSRKHDAVLTLVEELNALEGDGTWAWVGEADYYNDYPVRNELIYKVESVELSGTPMAFADPAFDAVRPGDTSMLPIGRPPLAQIFRPLGVKGAGQKFAVVVNHYKSKGSSCAALGDPFVDDGQGNCNLTRTAQSEALLGFVEYLQEESSGVLVIGDLNSYAMEDPITTLEDGGMTELLKHFIGPDAYSYVFNGQLGYLDTALATRSMLNKVVGVTVFHINADEADIFDYDTSHKKDAQDALYEALPYRVSDHDPVIIGLRFGGKK